MPSLWLLFYSNEQKSQFPFVSFCVERIVIDKKRLTCVCTWHNILLLLPAAFCVSETAVSFGLIVWSFVIFRRWCACTQLSQMNSEHSTHHDVAFASSAQLLHLMISFCVCFIDWFRTKKETKVENRDNKKHFVITCQLEWHMSVFKLVFFVVNCHVTSFKVVMSDLCYLFVHFSVKSVTLTFVSLKVISQ